MLNKLEELRTQKAGTFWGNPVIAFWGRDPQNGTWKWGVIIEKTTQEEAPLILPRPIVNIGGETHREEEAREKALELARKLQQP